MIYIPDGGACSMVPICMNCVCACCPEHCAQCPKDPIDATCCENKCVKEMGDEDF